MQSLTGGWRAVSDLAQTAIGTAQPVTELLNFEGTDLMEPEPDVFFENTTEVTGSLLPTKHKLLNLKFAGKHKSKATPSVVGLFASMAMGSDTATVVGATTAYLHKMQLNAGLVELPYRTMVENDGNSQFSFPGVACSGFTLSGARGQFCEFEADLIGSASEGADATAKPAANAESYLAYGDCNFFAGGAYDGTTVTGAASLSGQLVNFKLAFKNNAKGKYNVGDSSGHVGAIRRGLTYSVELDAEIELEDRSERAALLAGTEFVVHIPIVGGVANGAANYTVDIVLPRAVYKAAKKGVADGILKIAGKFAVLSDPVYGGFDLRVTNLFAHSYLATA
ncbi:MAG TPA: phage tail tube protein [Bryobacteraceae bacterium]|nr:phage tail tube protein [Bryobacteraceae bacterium]